MPIVLSFLSLLGLYLQVNVGFPYSLYILSGLLLFVYLPIRRAEIWVLLGTGAALLPTFCVVVPSQPIEYLMWDYVPSSGQLVLTVVSTLGLYKGLIKLQPSRFEQVFYWVLLVILCGTFLELAGPMRPLSDALRNRLYPPELTYEAIDRDIAEYGFYRPKFFTAEPSHLGKLVSLFLCLASVASPSPKRNMVLLVLSVLATAMIRSPACLIGIVVVAVNLVSLIGWKRIFRNPLVLIASFLLISLVGWRVSIEASRRLGFGGEEVESSAYIRLIGPVIATGEALRQRPVFGFGLGADSALKNVREVATYSHMSTQYVRDNAEKWDAVFGNAYSAFLIQFGVLGSLLCVVGIYLIKQGFGSGKIAVFWTFLATLGFFDPPINTPYFWGQVFLMLVAIEVGRHNMRYERSRMQRKPSTKSFLRRDIKPRKRLEALAS